MVWTTLRDVYLNGTPVANADGTLNFSGAAIDFRTGTQLQEPLPGFPAAENTIAVGAELKAAQHWTRLFANLQASAIRVTLGVEGLSKANTGNGDINGYRVEYAIDLSVDGAGYQEVLSSAFDGKTTQRYMRSHRIELPRARQGWSIRLRRITPNANSNTIADRTFIDSVTEVIDAKLRYPMSAVVGIKINASQFQSIPTRAYHVRGRIIRVPANYDPELRSYSGVWDGTFKLAWTNNPAWVFHDLISNDRYGLGTRVPAGWLDKWGLYQIGRYCDEMVDDGFGGRAALHLQRLSAAGRRRLPRGAGLRVHLPRHGVLGQCLGVRGGGHAVRSGLYLLVGQRGGRQVQLRGLGPGHPLYGGAGVVERPVRDGPAEGRVR